MAGEVGSALIVDTVRKAIQPAVDAIVLHSGYLLCYKSNIDNLNKRDEELRSTKMDAKNFFNSCGDNNEQTTNTSTSWLVRGDAAEDAVNGIKEDTENLKMGCWCPNPIKRYRLSKKAVKEAKEIQQLRNQGRAYVPLRKPAIPPAKLTGALANNGSKGFKSREKIMDDILEALKDDKISIIGVCGLGGVGKTTLMHELRERAKVNALFNEVAMATVSQKPDMSIIRFKLAEMLGLTRAMDGKNEIAIADELHQRLTGKGRRTLVILDDIWSEINLKELGIPAGIDQTQCKVVLTSRKFDICTQMKSHKTIPIAIMPPGEAWYLFSETIRDCVMSDDVKMIAKKVANECGGLPIALVTLAKALGNKKIGMWADALKQLQEHSVTRILEMDKKVYSSIKMSYDFLASELPEARPLLLLCCQHTEDAEISLEYLARYCLALRLYKNVDTIEDARNSVTSLMEHLTSCFLMEAIDVDDDDKNWGLERVKIHDIVRDVGLSIVSRAKEKRVGGYMQILEQSNNGGYELRTSEVDYQNLKILVHSRVDGGLMKKRFLSQMEELSVLEYISEEHMDLQLPAVEVLTNLRMLSLERADHNEDTWSKIGRLTKLEILSFLNSFNIGPFPHQVEQLSHLKLLDLRSLSEGSHQIPSGILPKLNKLETLYLGRYYFSGTPKDGEEVNERQSHGHIAELDTLPNLTELQVQLLNPMQLLELHLCIKKLKRFSFSTVGRKRRFFREGSLLVWRTLVLKDLRVELIEKDEIQFIVRTTEQLRVKQIDWKAPFIIEEFVSLQQLALNGCKHLKYIIDFRSDVGVFPNLKNLALKRMDSLTTLCQYGDLPRGTLGKLRKLELSILPSLRHLWVGPTDPLCLVNLREVSVEGCSALRFIFPRSAAKCLVQLQYLWVCKCDKMEGIVSEGEGTATGRVGEIIEAPTDLIYHFPKLRRMNLTMTSNLRGFYNLYDDNRWTQPLLSPLVMLPSLESLSVTKLYKLIHIVGFGIGNIPKFVASDWLQNLERLDVKSCISLESVFDFKGKLMAKNSHVVKLGKLQEIDLNDLPNLTCIFRSRVQDISIPEMQAIKVTSCGKLRNLVASNLLKLLYNLKRVGIIDCGLLEAVFDFEGLKVMRDARVILGELQEIELKKLLKLEHLCKLAPKEIHVFQNLRKLVVEDCGSLGYLISSSMAQMLVNLKLLSISDCKSMKECVKMDGCGEEKIVFRSLYYILLRNLETLSSFCSSDRQVFEFPSLKKVSIICCPEMKTFCCGHLTTEKLHGVEFSFGGKPVWKSDLNQTVRLFDPSDEAEDVLVVDNDNGDDDDETVANTVDGSVASYQVDDENAQGNNEGTTPELTSANTSSHISSASVLQEKASTERPLSDSFSSPDDYIRRRVLIQGVYVEANMLKTFEEILGENPNFLASLHVKTAMIKTALVETAIHTLQILRQDAVSSEQLVWVRQSLNDLAANGLNVAWLEKDYQRASIVL